MTVLYAKCSDIYMNEPYLIIATLNIEVKKKKLNCILPVINMLRKLYFLI